MRKKAGLWESTKAFTCAKRSELEVFVLERQLKKADELSLECFASRKNFLTISLKNSFPTNIDNLNVGLI